MITGKIFFKYRGRFSTFAGLSKIKHVGVGPNIFSYNGWFVGRIYQKYLVITLIASLLLSLESSAMDVYKKRQNRSLFNYAAATITFIVACAGAAFKSLQKDKTQASDAAAAFNDHNAIPLINLHLGEDVITLHKDPAPTKALDELKTAVTVATKTQANRYRNDEIKLANDLKTAKLAGQGIFAKVYVLPADGEFLPLAVKVVPIKTVDLREKVLREALLLMKFNHPNILGFVDHFEHNSVLFIFTELAKTSVGEALREGNYFSDETHRQNRLTLAAIGLLRGIAETERQQILHRDIKPNNILIRDDGTILIADFGFAIEMAQFNRRNGKLFAREPFAGSLSYMPPELLRAMVDELPEVDVARMDHWGAVVVIFLMRICKYDILLEAPLGTQMPDLPAYIDGFISRYREAYAEDLVIRAIECLVTRDDLNSALANLEKLLQSQK